MDFHCGATVVSTSSFFRGSAFWHRGSCIPLERCWATLLHCSYRASHRAGPGPHSPSRLGPGPEWPLTTVSLYAPQNLALPLDQPTALTWGALMLFRFPSIYTKREPGRPGAAVGPLALHNTWLQRTYTNTNYPRGLRPRQPLLRARPRA